MKFKVSMLDYCKMILEKLSFSKSLFKKEYLKDNINCDTILGLVIDILSELSILEKEIKDYQEEEDKVSAEYEKRREEKKEPEK